MYNEKNEIIYSVKISEDVGNECTGVYRSPMCKDRLMENFEDKPFNSVWEMFSDVADKFKDNDCLGSRIKENNKLGEYKWKTYGEVKELVMLIGSGLLNCDACPLIDCGEDKVIKARFLGFYMPNNPEWTICDLSCNAYNIITVPLYDSLGIESSKFILEQTLMKTIICNKSCALNLFKSLETCDEIYLKKLIFVDEIDDEIEKMSKKFNLELIVWNDLINEGKKNILEISPANPDAIASICYTSGTTGFPKGVIMVNRNMMATLNASMLELLKMSDLDVNDKDTHISYLPLAHIYERMILFLCFVFGIRIGYYSGNIQALIEDIQVLKPSIFISVPRLYNRIHERIYNSLKKKSHLIQALFNKGIDHKVKKLNGSGSYTHFLWDKFLFNKAKKIMGGNIKVMLNASAPISCDVVKKLKSIFCAPILEGYGMTETMGPSFLSHMYDPLMGHIGGPIACMEFKIVSVPEMNYFINDKPPKGELYLRGPSICKLGYFKLEKETKELINEDGWVCTGDIVVLNDNGSVSIIDRKKNIFKLSQGEYVAVEKIESSYRQSLFINQIFVFGYSSESFLVSVIFPSTDTIEIWKKNKKIDKNDEEIIILPDFKNDVINDLIKIGKNDGLKGYEQIKDIYFTLEPFTIENDLLTPTGKIKRHVALKKFKSQIDQMYQKAKNS
ncbi:acyl-CoA synthetase, putative [Plasmodium gallinaceum]|uniref:Acyl-CoA synthetase, putative n=1 Tax=Plasmodium gallinaceum TaxID=5849 RepID=A0A1J1GL21_PLAGA|nr:acyl-CoA synthetase, putative [Plasmodium gallinaceum]CRG93020.1 acyl-CoA synthetase, putative [Plasmodium gallinaceum]